MNETQTNAIERDSDYDESEFGLIDFLVILAKHKKVIIGIPLLAGIVVAAITFTLPEVYKAGTKLLPPQQAQSGTAALLSQLGGFAGAAAGAAGIKSPNDLYVGILKSRTIADQIVKKFQLNKVYGTDSPEMARKILADSTTITSGKDGLLTIDVEDENRKLVALLANSYVDELLKLTKVLAVTEAAQRRIFFERQLELSKNNLATAEMTLKGALDKRGVISVDGDSRAIVETVGRVRAQISAKEIELSSMQAFVTVNNQAYRRAQEELNSLHAELSRLENGRPVTAGGADNTPTKQVGLENIKILRDVKYHQMLYELLSKQYEAARLDEAKDTPVIQVLDAAIEPERKFKPKRALIVSISTIMAMFAAVLWAIVSETKQRALRRPKHFARWEKLKFHLRGR